jgi:hypothetical protein
MTATLVRRFTILCLAVTLFAIGLLTIVQNHARPPHVGQFELGAPCPQPQGVFCKVRI